MLVGVTAVHHSSSGRNGVICFLQHPKLAAALVEVPNQGHMQTATIPCKHCYKTGLTACYCSFHAILGQGQTSKLHCMTAACVAAELAGPSDNPRVLAAFLVDPVDSDSPSAVDVLAGRGKQAAIAGVQLHRRSRLPTVTTHCCSSVGLLTLVLNCISS